jgi:hypothetical protein
MQRSTKLQCIRALVALIMLGDMVCISNFPRLVAPGLLLLLCLIFVQVKLWRAFSIAVVLEAQAERSRL